MDCVVILVVTVTNRHNICGIRPVVPVSLTHRRVIPDWSRPGSSGEAHTRGNNDNRIYVECTYSAPEGGKRWQEKKTRAAPGPRAREEEYR